MRKSVPMFNFRGEGIAMNTKGHAFGGGVEWDELDRRPDVPPGAVIVVADAKGYTDSAMRGPVHMWTWIGADWWWYAEKFPVQMMEKVVTK